MAVWLSLSSPLISTPQEQPQEQAFSLRLQPFASALVNRKERFQGNLLFRSRWMILITPWHLELEVQRRGCSGRGLECRMVLLGIRWRLCLELLLQDMVRDGEGGTR